MAAGPVGRLPAPTIEAGTGCKRGSMRDFIASWGRPNSDTGGEFYPPHFHGVMRRSGAEGEVPDHCTGLPLDTTAPCHSAHSRLIRSPKRPDALPMPPS